MTSVGTGLTNPKQAPLKIGLYIKDLSFIKSDIGFIRSDTVQNVYNK